MYLRSSHFDGALESLQLEVQVLFLQEELAGRCRPLGVWWQSQATCLEDLSDREELGRQGEALSVHSLYKTTRPRSILEEGDGQFPPHGFSLMAFVLLASEGLVLANVVDHRGAYGELVHVAFLEDRLQVVSPSDLEGIACKPWRCMRNNFVDEPHVGV